MQLSVSPSRDAGYGLLLEKGPLAGQYYRLTLSICDNPVCQCEHVTLHCYSGRDASPESSRLSPVCLEMDLSNRAISNLDDLKADSTALTLATSVWSEMSEEEWTKLSMLYSAVKLQQTERADLNRLDVHFPPEVLAGDGSMVGYYEILPYSRPIAVSLDGARWYFDDQYCVNPGCSCREAAISFFAGDSSAVSDRPRNTREVVISYAYETGQITSTLTTRASDPSGHDLLHALKNAQPNLDAFLAERHLVVRRLFRRALAKTTIRVPSKAPGRNDPCPCGSGKKYKRCCGSS